MPWLHGILALLALIAVPGPAVASAAPARAARVEQAFAEWLVPTEDPGRFRWIAVAARKEFPPDGGEPATTVALVEGRCKVRSSGEEETIMCSGSPRTYALRPKAFSVDPVASTAVLQSRIRGHGVSVRWSAEDEAVDGAWWEQQDCSGESGLGAGASQLATATGLVFGVELPVENGGRDFAALDFGATAGQC